MVFQVPEAIRGERSTLYDRFVALEAEQGGTKEYATELVKLLPLSLRQAPVWFDKLSQIWRYEYGLPIDRLPENTFVFGTNLYFPVHELYVAMKLADRFLTREQLLRFLERMADRAKHQHIVFEMRPVSHLRPGLHFYYEVSGLGIGNTTCDWQIKGKLINLAFDVKYRTKSVISHMTYMIPGLNRGTANVRPPAPDPADLFKSVEGKFKERCYLHQLQGVWIHTSIKEDEARLVNYFRMHLSRRKIHFAILSDWQNDAFILARTNLIRTTLKRIFHLTETKRWVSSDYA